MIRFITRRPLLVLFIVGTIVLVGNGVLYINKPAQADAVEEKSSLEPIAAVDVSQLPTPRIGLPSVPANPPKIYAKSYVVLEKDSKRALAEKDADTPRQMASTTKLMTALIATETMSLDQVVTIPKQTYPGDASLIDLMPGEKITVQSLLYALLLNSAQNAADSLAQANGNQADFIAKMNAKAKLLGMSKTVYKDPSGYTDENVSTARDLARLAEYIVTTNPTLQTIMATPQYTITAVDGRYAHQLDNSDRLVKADSGYYLPGTLGGKTGFTYAAGHCLVTVAKSASGKIYSAAVLFTNEDTVEASAKEMYKLLSWAVQS